MSHKEVNDVLELFNQKHLVKICAPMVRYSKLQFRTLVKQYDCDLVFTPMILADSFCKSAKARDNEFTTNLLDTPLITQFAANTVHDFVGASYMVSPFCDGVDLNCGCPQRWAKEMHLGCEMLRSPQKIFELVRECRNRIPKPFTISVKTRIQKSLKDTVSVCQGLEKSGVSFLTIHARTPDNNVGPINEESLKLVTESVQMPIVGNGGINNLNDCSELQDRTGVKGVMIANEILTNPEIFLGAKETSLQCIQDWLNICFNSTLTMEAYEKIANQKVKSQILNKEYANIYGSISEKPYNLTFQCFHHHLVFMLEKVLTRRQRQVFNNLKNFSSALDFLEIHFGLRPQLFTKEHFNKTMLLNLEYEGRNSVYDELKPLIVESSKTDFLEYGYNQSNGKYFMQKFSEEVSTDCDWSNMFFEND